VRFGVKQKILLVSEFGGADQPYTYATSFDKYLTRMGYAVTCFNCKRVMVPFWSWPNAVGFVLRSLNDWLINRALKSVFSKNKS